jgi:hypothetical protein
MTATSAELKNNAIPELIERRRVARLIALGSASFTGLIGIVAGILAVLD